MTRPLSVSRWLYFFFPSFLSSVLLMAYYSMLQAPESHTGRNLILGNLGCVSSFDLTAWISSALWFTSWLWFSDVSSALTERCSWVAIWEAQPIFVLWIFNPSRELNFLKGLTIHRAKMGCASQITTQEQCSVNASNHPNKYRQKDFTWTSISPLTHWK